MPDRLLFFLTQKLAVLFVVSLSAAGGFLASASGPSGSAAASLPQAAIIASVVVTSAPPAPDIQSIPPGFLNSSTTTIPFCVVSMPCGTKNLKALAAQAAKRPKSTPAPLPVVSSLLPTVRVRALPITASSLVASATLSFKATRTGPYEIIINSGAASWNVGAQTIGPTGSGANGAAAAPRFSTSFVCDPLPGVPDAGAPDQNPFFATDMAYDCNLSITPLSGSDLQTQSKNFSFTTPAGQLLVTTAASMDTILTNSTNDGGIVFDNQDTSPVTVTGLTFDVSYSYLDTLNGPLVFRILDPATSQSMFDYHLENAPADSALPFTNSQAGVSASISFTIPGMSQKMLPVELLGVQRMLVMSSTPSANIILKNVTTDRSGMKINIDAAQASWSCVVPANGYDPTATQGSVSTGQTCQD